MMGGKGMGMGMGMGMMGGRGQGMGMGMMGGKGMGMMEGMEMDMMEEMLTAEQRTEMRKLMHEHRPAQFERMGQLMNLRDDLKAEMQLPRPDPDAVRERHGRMAEAHGEIMAERIRLRNAMHDLLTDEQREQLRKKASPPDDNDAAEDHDAHH
ncbi:hypothetical protein THITH_08895 [Thioalkalivibrio paradoxus ARh 1]|uniref:Signaling pathway modulator ZraP n=2 Tax=Thioalkalivibrio paradoxus TaxID=108010 RepID=W0DM72_9GAMM|nr:hypothetical protein THITH_08895 [Thioalkalivibrio paradoxus ARh 1]